ncbi:hypothetical protein A0H81_08238 [Grifola frondosa]|uniref:Uncharacterized protein n=1 Tax=Grifola frondosa TaxID=5627 RepID=A0A1C7MA15_GRIFR|nr:hypothetical protein A0H81_08238 [Grifola frondosa]
MTPEQIEAVESIKPGIVAQTEQVIALGRDGLEDLSPEIETVQSWYQRYNVFNSVCAEFLTIEKKILMQNTDFAETTKTYRRRVKGEQDHAQDLNRAPAASAAMMYDLTRLLHNAVAFTIETLRPTIAQAALRDQQLQAPEANSYPIIGIA